MDGKHENRYALAVIFSCFIVSICAPLLIDIPYLGSNGSIHRALSTLIALSPCAMLIAIPICYVSSSNSYTERGVLLRNSKALNALAKMKTIAFDKTGTLTHPTLSITSITCWSSSGKESSVTQETIRRIVSLETQVMHPMSTAILNWGYKILTTINLHKIYSIRTVPGKGICGDLENGSIQIAIGELEFIKPFVPRELHTAIIETKSNNSMCWAWTGDQLIFFTFSETLRSGVEELFESFKNKRIKTIILSGDKYQNANNLCGHLKGTKILAELTPEEKLNIITELKKEGPIVMVGDGLNDGPAMLSADASIAMGGMSHHITTENSDIVILDDRIDKLNWIIEKAKKTRIIVAQNVFLAITSIAIGAIFAILGKTSLWVAVLLHEGSTILVSMNGIRLLW